jgi:hypothetical protein
VSFPVGRAAIVGVYMTEQASNNSLHRLEALSASFNTAVGDITHQLI